MSATELLPGRRSPTPWPLSLLKVVAFPLLTATAVAAATLAYAPGREPVLTPAIFLFVMAIAIFLERHYPFDANWNASWSESHQDGAYFLLTQPVVLAADITAITLGTMAAIHLSRDSGASVWLAGLPLIVQVSLALLISDLLPYLYHRLSHESSGLLWRIHAIHHAPSRLYTLNFIRLHPVNTFASQFLGLLPLALLGMSPKVIFIVAIVHKVHSLLSHTNFDFRLGPLNWIFSMAELHRWHHARDLRLANANYGSTLIVWDVLFGTRVLPHDDVRLYALGLQNESEVPAGFCRQICHVFKAG